MIKSEYFITFRLGNGRLTQFTRWEATEADAIESAKDGFQESYGYWPTDESIVQIMVVPAALGSEGYVTLDRL